jgi:hypothetical protein
MPEAEQNLAQQSLPELLDQFFETMGEVPECHLGSNFYIHHEQRTALLCWEDPRNGKKDKSSLNNLVDEP